MASEFEKLYPHCGFNVKMRVASDGLHFEATPVSRHVPNYMLFVHGKISPDGVWHATLKGLDNGVLFGRSRDDMKRLAAMIECVFGEARRVLPDNTIPASEYEAAAERLEALIASLQETPQVSGPAPSGVDLDCDEDHDGDLARPGAETKRIDRMIERVKEARSLARSRAAREGMSEMCEHILGPFDRLLEELRVEREVAQRNDLDSQYNDE
jgi:hypothetical protein